MRVLLKRVTALSGSLLLLWLFFSPIIGGWTLFRFYPEPNFIALVLSALVAYIFIGIIFFNIAKYFGFTPEPNMNDMIPLEEISQFKMNYRFEITKMLLLASPLVIFKPLLVGASFFPLAGGVIGVLVFLFVCLINWYKPLRVNLFRGVNFGEINPTIAAFRRDEILYALNAPLVFISGMLMISMSLFLFP